MTNQHPLTDEVLEQFGMTDDIYCDYLGDDVTRIYFDKDMRSAFDLGFDRALKWLKTTPPKTGREGALEALERLHRENAQGLKWLADS